MLKLNVIQIINNKKITKYQLFNTLNAIRAERGEKLMNYTF